MAAQGGIPTHPPLKSGAKLQGGWVGETSLGRRTDGQGALARASHNSCTEGIGRHVRPCKELRFSKALVGRRRCPIAGGCVAAKAHRPPMWQLREVFPPTRPLPLAASAHWRPMERSRNCPAHPPPSGAGDQMTCRARRSSWRRAVKRGSAMAANVRGRGRSTSRVQQILAGRGVSA